MKKYLKDIIIAIIIGISLSYIIYSIQGGILYGDLYNQGIDFLEYYRDNISIFGIGYNYNWNIALGDNMYALAIYYLMSPFNIILIFLRSLKMELALPIFITIKFIFLIYFASLYFKKVTSNKFKWYGAIFYAASYYILNYGAIQIMWLDTFIFLPLVLLGIEKIINKEDSKLYIISLFLFISTDYYLAALLVPHIAIYSLIRYIVLRNDCKEIFLFIWTMIKKSIIGVLLSSFVLLPAAIIMLSSAKETGVTNNFGINLYNIFSILTQNYIGATDQSSNTYVTLIGIPVLISFLIFSKNKKYKLYFIHIGIIMLALFIERFNYILNFTYKPVGGDFRYNLFLNIYGAIYIFLFIKEKGKNNNIVVSFNIISILSLLFIFFNKDLSVGLKIINLIFVVIYLSALLLIKRKFKFLSILLSLFLLLEVAQQYSIVVKSNKKISNETREQYSNVLKYIEDKYGEDNRIEIRGTEMSRNIYLANEAEGVSAYHSLVNGNYKNISKAFSNTIKNDVRVEFKGRNIISQYIGTSYYVSSYNYCPYYNSKLIDKAYNFYIFEVKNKPFKFFDSDSIIKGKFPASMIEKDILLYSNLLIEEDGEEIQLDESLSNNYAIYPIEQSDTFIQENGEYYVISKKQYKIDYIPFIVNGSNIGEDSSFTNINIDNLDYNELYIGKLNYGDVLTIDEKYIGAVELFCIKENYIEESIKNMNYVDVDNLIKDKKGLKSTFNTKSEGYIVLPVIEDKYWNIKVDGEEVKPTIVNGGLIAIYVEAGEHNLEMNYNFYYKGIGVLISLSTLILIILYKIYLKKYLNIKKEVEN
ncbi:YfhO family protein [Clostridium nigeriense]|uniref:YfhO family protein n=1 Tax=Clostridium nigeriense TaxID=1805470 RepID=UPI003D3291D3